MLFPNASKSGKSIGFGVKENNFLGRGIGLNSNVTISTESIKGLFAVTNPNFLNSDKFEIFPFSGKANSIIINCNA